MKIIIYFLAIFLTFVSLTVNADKPKWAEQKHPPSFEERSSHKSDMTSKNNEKSKKGNKNKDKGNKNKKDSNDNQKDKKME